MSVEISESLESSECTKRTVSVCGEQSVSVESSECLKRAVSVCGEQ